MLELADLISFRLWTSLYVYCVQPEVKVPGCPRCGFGFKNLQYLKPSDESHEFIVMVVDSSVML